MKMHGLFVLAVDNSTWKTFPDSLTTLMIKKKIRKKKKKSKHSALQDPTEVSCDREASVS
jgi:hypothetical protein